MGKAKPKEQSCIAPTQRKGAVSQVKANNNPSHCGSTRDITEDYQGTVKQLTDAHMRFRENHEWHNWRGWFKAENAKRKG